MTAKDKAGIAEKMKQLDEMVAWFDGEDFALEAALDKYKEAKALADEIEHDLTELENTISVIGHQFDKAQE